MRRAILAISGDYPADWPEMEAKLGPRSISPIKADVALPAKTNEIGNCICFGVVFKAEFLERNDMRHRKVLFASFLSATQAFIAIPLPCQAALCPPTRSIIGDASALPVWTILCNKVLGKPNKPTFGSTKPFSSTEGTDGTMDPAYLANIVNSWPLEMRVTFS
jgi:hypothetical protein